MAKRTKKDPTAWRDTLEGTRLYNAARVITQAKADATGFDFGLEANDIFHEYSVRMLPMKQHRSGSELRCEVVMCSNLSTCQPGHGPMAKG